MATVVGTVALAAVDMVAVGATEVATAVAMAVATAVAMAVATAVATAVAMAVAMAVATVVVTAVVMAVEAILAQDSVGSTGTKLILFHSKRTFTKRTRE